MRGIAKFVSRVKATGSIVTCPDGGQPSEVTEVKQHVENQMRSDDEITVIQLHVLLMSTTCTYVCMSLKTVLRCRGVVEW